MRGSFLRLSVICLVVSGLLIIPTGPTWAQKKKKADDEMTFDADRVAKPGKTGKKPPPDTSPPSKTLERATKLYDEKKYALASIEFAKVINKQSNDSLANVQRAEFFMGKTLYQLGFYAASLAYFDKIVQQGAGHRYHGATLKWLAALSRVLPENSGILEKIGRYDAAELEDPVLAEVRDELLYLLGRHYFAKAGEENFDIAIGLFKKIPPKSPFFVKSKFFEATTQVRKNAGRAAVDAFKEILIIGQERPAFYTEEDIQTYEELANLQLARVFYTNGQFDTSIKYYEKIPQSSPDWLPSLFEASWAYFIIGKSSKALGNIHTLNAPYFQNEFFYGMPESLLLSAVIYYNYCLYDRALEKVEEYNRIYRPLREQIKTAIDKYEDNAEFYKYVSQILNEKAGLNPVMQRLMLSALSDRTLKKTFAWVDELERELTAHAQSDLSWQDTRIAGEVLQELTVQKSLAEADAGRLARERLMRLEGELRNLSRDGSRIRIEVLEAQAGQHTAKARGEEATGEQKPEPIIVDDEHFVWGFNGEYWKDELGFYRFKIQSKCAGGNK
jgi:tetratricopeptide (TPR) repeat protein